MNRSDFLKSLGLGVAGIVLPQNSFISVKTIKIYDNYIKGLSHYHFHNLKYELNKGNEVQLKREPENIYDSFAIQVNYSEYRLGYISAFENIVLANMMDYGVHLKAYISQKDLSRKHSEWLAVEVYTELVIPSQKLIDTVLLKQRASDVHDIYRKGFKF